MVAIDIRPPTALADEEPRIGVRGLSPGERVQLDASFTDDAQVTWLTRGVYFADADGCVDVARQANVARSNLDMEPRGLLWSAAACEPEDRTQHLAARRATPGSVGVSTWSDPLSPVCITLRASRLEGHALAPLPIVQHGFIVERIDAQVRVTAVRQGRIRGRLYEPTEVPPPSHRGPSLKRAREETSRPHWRPCMRRAGWRCWRSGSSRLKTCRPNW